MGVAEEDFEGAFFFRHIFPTKLGITKLYNQKRMLHSASRIAKFGFNWVIVGGEFGPGARPIMQEWVTDIQDQCLREAAKVLFSSSNGVTFRRRAAGGAHAGGENVG